MLQSCVKENRQQRLCVYRSRSWVRDLSSVLLPFRAGILVFHVGSLEGLLDIRQGESTHCRCLHVSPKYRNTHRQSEKKTRADASYNNNSKPRVAIGTAVGTTVQAHLTDEMGVVSHL